METELSSTSSQIKCSTLHVKKIKKEKKWGGRGGGEGVAVKSKILLDVGPMWHSLAVPKATNKPSLSQWPECTIEVNTLEMGYLIYSAIRSNALSEDHDI